MKVIWLISWALLMAIASCGGAAQNGSEKQQVSGDPSLKADEARSRAKILFVLTSHEEKGDTGEKTGFFLSEAAHPWAVLKETFDIEFVSPRGGAAPVDGMDLSDPVNKTFWETPEVRDQIAHTLTPEQIDPSAYAAILFVGGHGTMWDFPDNEKLAALAAEIYEAGGVVSAVCHGPAGLVNVKLPNGDYLIDGKKVTGFTNAEEAAVALTDVVPFLLEDQLKARGASFSSAEKFAPHVVRDGRLITGQNPASAEGVGQAILDALRP